MEIINNLIRDRAVELCNSLDIAQYSFIVQNSLTPLNLELCQSYNVSDGQQNNNYPSFSFSKEFISTEEKCRKVLTKSRSVLYNLHLDLPRNRERSLKVNSEHMELSRDWKIPNVAKIHVRNYFYDEIMYSLIHDACKGKDNNLKILKWFLNFRPLEKSLFYELPCSIINYFFDSMHPGLNDSEYVIECLRKLDVMKWLINGGSSKPGRFANLLYLIHRNGRNVKCSCCIDEVIDFCISLSSVQITEAVLKLKNAPSFCKWLFYFYVDGIFHKRSTFLSRKKYTAMSLRRRTLLLQMFWIYIRKSENPSEASEFLRLIWDSVPDSFLSKLEIQVAFEEGFSSEEITDVYALYSSAVGVVHPYVIPRTLKHYCRTAIRRRLSQNGHWLPEGIKEFALPDKLPSYLKLEEFAYKEYA